MAEYPYIPFKFPLLDKIFCVFTTKHAGDILKKETKNRIKKDFDLKGIVELSQEHKNRMIFVDDLFYKTIPKGDAAASTLTDIALMIKSADCQPVLLSHISQKYIAAFHVGWRANRGDYILEWIKLFCEKYTVLPEELFAVRGPSLSFYASEFVNFHEEWGEGFKKYYNFRLKTVDLWSLTKDQLCKAGLKRENIFSIDICTFYSDFFFSFRRERALERQASLIWIRSYSKELK